MAVAKIPAEVVHHLLFRNISRIPSACFVCDSGEATARPNRLPGSAGEVHRFSTSGLCPFRRKMPWRTTISPSRHTAGSGGEFFSRVSIRGVRITGWRHALVGSVVGKRRVRPRANALILPALRVGQRLGGSTVMPSRARPLVPERKTARAGCGVHQSAASIGPPKRRRRRPTRRPSHRPGKRHLGRRRRIERN